MMIREHKLRKRQKRGQNGQGHFGHFRFRKRGHCSLYINIYIYNIVAVLTASVFDFDK